MKYTVNTKKVLKASIALSSIVLFGCIQAHDDEWSYQNYQSEPQIVDYDVADDTEVLEEAFFIEEGVQDVPCVKVASTSGVRDSISSSRPAEPRVVPVKPTDKCVVCKTAQTEEKNTAPDTVKVTVKHKPQVPPTPVVEIKTVEPLPVLEKVRISEQVAEVNAKDETEFPVIDSTVEKQSKEQQTFEDDDFVVIDDVVDENIVIDVQDDEKRLAAEEEAKRLAAEQEAKRLAEEKAKRLAEEEARRLEAEQEAERIKLQREVERLAAEKKALENEKVRITQIKRTTVESCEDVKDWVATEGTTLRSLLMDWGDRVGWRVVWNMDRDYTLEAGAVFRGRFVDVAAALIRSFARAVPAPKGVFYKGNKVLVVSTREDENAD